MKGTIVKLVSGRGFGFIKPDDGAKEIFFHAKSLEDITYEELKEGDVVTYEVEDGPKGTAAAHVARA